MSLKIKSGTLISPENVKKDSIITIQDGRISSVDSGSDNPVDLDFSDYTVVPGFIDIHTHGYYGIDSFSSSDTEILEWSRRITETGVTSFIPTLVSLPLEDIYFQFDRYRKLISAQREGASILGLRCEGPYLSEEKRGAHNLKHLRVPQLKEVEQLFTQGEGVLKIIDIAPELGDIAAIVKLAMERGILISTGHSNTDYETAVRSFDSGSPLITHFYNAMSNLSHREVGLVGAGLLHNRVALELIADLHHVSLEATRLLEKMRGFHNVVLITDSLAVGGNSNAKLTLGGLPVTLHDGVAWIGDTSTIAGSVLTIDLALRNLVGSGYKLENLIYSTSAIQARLLGINDLGHIKPGYRADLTVMDEKGEIVATIKEGKMVYRNL